MKNQKAVITLFWAVFFVFTDNSAINNLPETVLLYQFLFEVQFYKEDRHLKL